MSVAMSNESLVSPKQEVLVLTAGWSPLLSKYFRAVAEKAVLNLQENGGNYSIKYLDKSHSIFRTRKIATDEGYLYIDFSANRPTENPEPHQFPSLQRMNYQLPLLKGILGLRKIIIKKDKQNYISNINTITDFRSLSAGLVSHWPEVAIFENIGVNVRKSLSYENLFPMLDSSRFDYLSLGIIEIDEALKQQTRFSEKLSIAEDIYVFYYVPIYVNTLKKYKQESQDIISSFETIIENGELDRIFDDYFGHYIKQINPTSAKVFFVHNYGISQQMNEDMMSKTRQLFFDEETSFFELEAKKELRSKGNAASTPMVN